MTGGVVLLFEAVNDMLYIYHVCFNWIDGSKDNTKNSYIIKKINLSKNIFYEIMVMIVNRESGRSFFRWLLRVVSS